MPPQDLNNRIEELSKEIERQNDKIKKQDDRIFVLESKPVELDRLLGVQSKRIIQDAVSDEIHNSLWDNISFTSSFASASINTAIAFTVTIASPAVFTKSAHGLTTDTPIRLFTTDTLPTGLTANTTYYVIATGLTTNTFQLSTTIGGSAINTSGTQSGSHTYITTKEILDANGRESDTSLGRRFRPERECRFRTTFYINSGLSDSIIYITAPAVLATSSIGTAMIDANKSYVGVKIINGSIYLVSSVAGTETTQSTTSTITDTSTNLIEINYYVSSAVIFLNGVSLGSIACNLKTITLNTFCPFLTSVSTANYAAVNLTMEAYEFLQKRK